MYCMIDIRGFDLNGCVLFGPVALEYAFPVENHSVLWGHCVLRLPIQKGPNKPTYFLIPMALCLGELMPAPLAAITGQAPTGTSMPGASRLRGEDIPEVVRQEGQRPAYRPRQVTQSHYLRSRF